MQNIRIVLLFVTTAYFVTIEALNIIIKDLAYLSSDDYEDDVVQWLKKIQSEEISRHKKQKDVNSLVNLLEKISDEERGKKSLRESSYSTVQDFLHKLNNYINRNTQNYYYEKRDDCHFGFGHPGWNLCKRNKSRRYNKSDKSKGQKRKGKDKLNYAQHMVVERARYKSSSEFNSDESGASLRHKSRFRIVDNVKKHKSKGRQKSSVEQSSDSDDEMIKDKESSVEQKNVQSVEESDSSDEEPRIEVSEEYSNKRNKRKEKTDENYMYLQGTRMQNPNFRAGRLRESKKAARRTSQLRLPHFLPKRFKWDPAMLTQLDELWIGGIKTYNQHHQRYERHWPYKYFK